MLLAAIFDDPMSVLFIEHKLLYARPLVTESVGALHVSRIDGSDARYPVARVANYAEGTPDVTLALYGGMSIPAMEAMEDLTAEEIRVEAFVPTELSDPWLPTAAESAGNTKRLVGRRRRRRSPMAGAPE